MKNIIDWIKIILGIIGCVILWLIAVAGLLTVIVIILTLIIIIIIVPVGIILLLIFIFIENLNSIL